MRMDPDKVSTIGGGLIRPEGVMALEDGSLITADGRGCCSHIQADGRTRFFGDLGGMPNGICIDPAGHVIVANIGNGQVQAVAPDGRHTVLATQAGDRRLKAPNFPLLDARGRLWVTDSTLEDNLNTALMRPIPDGCVVCIENGRPRVVADGICFANGLAMDRDGTFLYVAQTMRSNILRFAIRDDGSLGPAEIFGPSPLTHQGYPDGIAFDTAGNLWITFPQRNAVGYLTATGELCMFLEDPQRRVLQRPANICFGGPGRRTAYIGSLNGGDIPFFEVPHPGLALVHQKEEPKPLDTST